VAVRFAVRFRYDRFIYGEIFSLAPYTAVFAISAKIAVSPH